MATMFTPILLRAVERVPGAMGAIFADWDGEAVDHVAAAGAMVKDTLLMMGAHYGIVLNHVQSALHLFHFGEAEEIILHHEHVDLLVRSIGSGYYVLLAVRSGAHLATALRALREAAQALGHEVG